MAAGLPLLKLGGLLLRTISKPAASRLKVAMQNRPRLYSAAASVGEFSHQLMSRINVFATGYKFIGVKPLEKEEAFKQGVDLITEIFLFSVAGSIIVIETFRSDAKAALKAAQAAEKDAKQKEALENRFLSIEQRLIEVEMRLEKSMARVLLPGKLEQRMKEVDSRLSRVEANVGNQESSIARTTTAPEARRDSLEKNELKNKEVDEFNVDNSTSRWSWWWLWPWWQNS